MTESCESHAQGYPARPPARRRTTPSVADVFGEVLPDVTTDERTPEPGGGSPDSWYEENRPPHHDRG